MVRHWSAVRPHRRARARWTAPPGRLGRASGRDCARARGDDGDARGGAHGAASSAGPIATSSTPTRCKHTSSSRSAPRLRGRRAVLHQHDLVVPGMGRDILGAATRVAGELIAISAAVAACVPAGAQRYVDIVHHGVDLQRFSPAPADPAVRAALGARGDERLVGILGRVDPRKQVDLVVRAMAKLDAARVPVHLAVVGGAHLASPEYSENLRREADALLGDRVHFVGPRADVPDVLRGARRARQRIRGRAVRTHPRRGPGLRHTGCGDAVRRRTRSRRRRRDRVRGSRGGRSRVRPR